MDKDPLNLAPGKLVPAKRLMNSLFSLMKQGGAAIFFLLAVVISGCSDSPRVVVYTSVDQPYAETIFKVFTQKTGIRVEPLFDIEAAKTVGLVNRLRAEARATKADVFWNSEFVHTLRLAEEGLTASFSVSTAVDIPEIYRDPQSRWLAFGLRARVLLINTNLVASTSWPTRLSDLLDPKWEPGQLALSNPLFGSGNTHAGGLCVLLGETGMANFFQGLKDRGALFLDGNAVVRDRIVAGACKAGIVDSDDALIAVARKDPVVMIIPDQGPEDPGTLLIPNTVSLLKNAPHPNEARELISFLVSRECEALLARGESRQISVRTMGKEHPDWIPSQGIRGYALSLKQMGDGISSATGRLKEIFLR